MVSRLFRLYQRRRVININANIAFAGIVSTAMVAGLLWALKHVFSTGWPTWGYTAFSVVTDMILDVAIFVVLHWVANHWRPLRARDHREHLELSALPPPHVQDAARVQLERAVISPLYYLIAAGGTEICQRLGLAPYLAVMIAYPVGLIATRTLHTFWGIKTGTYEDHHRREKRERIRRRREERARGIRPSRFSIRRQRTEQPSDTAGKEPDPDASVTPPAEPSSGTRQTAAR